jgi:antitoxin component YwqK of YwqJK toxin-antitoxin module
MGKYRNTRWNTHPRNTQWKYTKQSTEPKKPDLKPVLIERQGLWYKVNSTTPFTGTQERYYENGQLQYRWILKNGKQHGLYQGYFKNGELESKNNCRDGVLHGPLEEYQKESIGVFLVRRGNYKDGEPHGTWEWYFTDWYQDVFSNGDLKTLRTFKDGVPHGPFEEYKRERNMDRYKNKLGISFRDYILEIYLSSKGNYKEGKLDFEERYNMDGSIIEDMSSFTVFLLMLIGLGIIILPFYFLFR